jgi:preprotein translocase subunit SecA
MAPSRYKITGDPNEKEIKSLHPLVDDINALEEDFARLSDEELKAKTDEFRARFHKQLDEERASFDELKRRWLDEADEKERRSLDIQVKERQPGTGDARRASARGVCRRPRGIQTRERTASF